MPSGITNLNDLQTFAIAALYRGLQAGGNMRGYSANYNAYKSPTGRRQPVRVPYFAEQKALAQGNPEGGLAANAAAIGHSIIEWKTGAAATDTSFPIAYSYDRWELQSTGLAVETVAAQAAVQVQRYEQSYDTDAIAELKAAANWGLAANQRSVAITAASPTSAQIEDLVQAALGIPWAYWRRGMTRRPGGSDDGSPQREIVCVMNVAVMQAIIGEYFDDVAVGRAINDQGWLQSTLGPMLGGMTLVVSHGMDDGITAAGDEYAFGTFLRGSLAYVDDDSPMIDAVGYTAAGAPTLEQRVGFWRDHGIKQLAANECYAVKLNAT